MDFPKKQILLSVIAFSSLILAGCSNVFDYKNKELTLYQGIDLSLFAEGAFTQQPEIVDCVTSEGTQTSCYKLVTSGAPAGRAPGPFCPRTTSDGPKAGGAWFSKQGSGDLVDITGEFILKLSNYYII